jgi:hypothetical protein
MFSWFFFAFLVFDSAAATPVGAAATGLGAIVYLLLSPARIKEQAQIQIKW